MENKPQNGILKFVNDNWKIGVFLVAVIVAWTQLRADVQVSAEDIKTLKGNQMEFTQSINSINTNLAEINTSLKFIEKQLK